MNDDQDTAQQGAITIGEIGRSMARMERKLDDMVADHEQRIRKLEQFMWMSMALGGGGLATGVAAILNSAGLV